MERPLQKFRSISSNSSKKYRKWNKIIQPLVKFNRQSQSLSNPLDFTAFIEQILSNGYKLQLNIPQTLEGTHDNCFQTIFDNPQQKVGTVKLYPGVLKHSFERKVQSHLQQQKQEIKKKTPIFREFFKQKVEGITEHMFKPFVIIKEQNYQKNNTFQFSSSIMTQDEYKKLLNIQVNQIAQCYIYGIQQFISMTRFFYVPSKPKSTMAFKIDNCQTYLNKKYNRNCWKVKCSHQYSFLYLKIMHENKNFFIQTKNLVAAIQHQLKVTVTKIVCDWIQDAFQKYWLIDVKQINFENKKSICKITKNISDVLSYIACAVCNQTFRVAEINKVITRRLIWIFFQHLKKRQIKLSFTSNYRDTSDTCKVCDLCFMIVVSESKLIQMEMKIAIATHSISFKSEYHEKKQENTILSRRRQKSQGSSYRKRQNSPIDPQQKKIYFISTSLKKQQSSSINQYSYLSKKHLHLWRLFLYIEDIKDFQETIQNHKEDNYYIMLRIHDLLTSFKIRSTQFSKKNQACNVALKAIKIFYLFSDKSSIDEFLSKTQIVVRIVTNNDWNKIVGEGSSYGLYQETEKSTMRKYKQILIFNSQSKYSVTGLHIGVKYDGFCESAGIKLNPIYDAYVPTQDYMNCNPLPAEWMEIIDPSYCIFSNANSTLQYQHSFSKKQKQKLFPCLPNNKNKLKL